MSFKYLSMSIAALSAALLAPLAAAQEEFQSTVPQSNRGNGVSTN